MKAPILGRAIPMLLLSACTRRDPAPDPAHAEPAPLAPPAAASVTADGGGAPDADGWSDSTVLHATPSAFCTDFVRSVAAARSYGAPTPKPTCTLAPAPRAWRAKAPFVDARSMKTKYVHREATNLLVQTAAGWYATDVEWNVVEIEGATRPWNTEEPERIDIDGSRLLVYAGGADHFWNEVVTDDGGGLHAEDRSLRGAYGCELGATLVCWLWDPTKRAPLGAKSAPSGFTAWTTLPWQGARDLDFATQWPKRP